VRVDLSARGRRISGRAVAIVTVVAVCAGIASHSVGHHSEADRTALPPPTRSAVAAGAPVVPAVLRIDSTLPQPSGYLGAIPTGYPQTIAGAVAAAYGYSRVASVRRGETKLDQALVLGR